MFKKSEKIALNPLPINDNSFTAVEWNSLNGEIYNMLTNVWFNLDNILTDIPTDAGIEDTQKFMLQTFDLIKSLDNDDSFYIDKTNLEYVRFNVDLQYLPTIKIISNKKYKNNVYNLDNNGLITSGIPELVKFYKFDVPLFVDNNGNPIDKKPDVNDTYINIESDDFIQNTNRTQKMKFSYKQYYETIGKNVDNIVLKRKSGNTYEFLPTSSSSFDYNLPEYKFFDKNEDIFSSFFKIKRLDNPYGSQEYNLILASYNIDGHRMIQFGTDNNINFGTSIDGENIDYLYYSLKNYEIVFYESGNGNIALQIGSDSILGSVKTIITNDYHFTTKKYVNDYVTDSLSNIVTTFDYSLNSYKFTGYDGMTPSFEIKVIQDGYNYFQNIYTLCITPATSGGNVKTSAILNNIGLFLGITNTIFTSQIDINLNEDYIYVKNKGDVENGYIELFSKNNNSKLKINSDSILGDVNTKMTNNYHFVNKKYVDDLVTQQSVIINDLKTRLDSYDTKYRSFTSKRVKSGLNVTINSNANILTNLTKYFVASQNPIITSFGSSISGLPLGPINLIEVGTGANQGFRFPLIDGIVNANLTFTVRVTGSISGNAGTARELIVYLKRVSDNSLVANGGIIKVNDNNFNARSVIVPSFLQGIADSFYTGGFYLDLLNKSDGNLTLQSIEMLIQG